MRWRDEELDLDARPVSNWGELCGAAISMLPTGIYLLVVSSALIPDFLFDKFFRSSWQNLLIGLGT